MRLAFSVALVLAALGLTACESMDTSRMGEQIARSQCRADADRYPGALEDCEGVGSGRRDAAIP